MPPPRAPGTSAATLSPTIAAVAGSRPMRSSAIRNSGASGLPTTRGRTPAATATAATSAPQPGRNSPSSCGRRRAPLGGRAGGGRAPGDRRAGGAGVVGEERQRAAGAVERGQRLAGAGAQDPAVPDAAVQGEDEPADAPGHGPR